MIVLQTISLLRIQRGLTNPHHILNQNSSPTFEGKNYINLVKSQYYLRLGAHYNKNKNKNHSAAMMNDSKALMHNPQNAIAYYKRGNLKRALKDFYGAIKDYAIAHEHNPYNNKAMINSAITQDMIGDYRSSIRDADIALKVQKNEAGVYCTRARAKYLTADYQGALQDYKKTLEYKLTKGRRLATLNNLAIAQIKMSNYAGAHKTLEEILKIDDCCKQAETNMKYVRSKLAQANALQKFLMERFNDSLDYGRLHRDPGIQDFTWKLKDYNKILPQRKHHQ